MSNDEPTPHRESSRRRRANAEGGRQHRHVVKVTPEEAGRLAVLATRQRVTVPRLLVESALALGDQGGIADRRVAIEVLFELRRVLAGVANNVNQMTHYTNLTGEIDRSLEDTLEQVRACVSDINETLEAMRL